MIAAAFLASPAAATVPLGCAESVSLGTFQLTVRPFSQGAPLPLKSLASVPGGSRLLWNPLHLTTAASNDAEVAAVLVPSADGVLLTLEPRQAKARTEWQLPESPEVIALIYGPQGLSQGKIKSLVTHNQELLKQLAAYAEQSSQVEALVQQLANSEQAGGRTDAVLKGFSSRYGVSLPKLESGGTSNQQAATLLNTLVPSSNAYDPLAPKSAQIQQSGGLAASVAGLFFGNPVGLAAGGATLFQNLKTALFPATDFRSAFVQADADGLALCTKSQAPTAKTRNAYLWAYRVPDLKRPTVSLAESPNLLLGSKSAFAVKVAPGRSVADLARAREWRMEPLSGGPAVPVPVHIAAPDSVEIDLSHTKAMPGDYHLAAAWDWDPLSIAGTLHLHAPGDLSRAQVTAGARDRLLEGSGTVAVELTGADFEFLDKAALEPAVRNAKAVETSFVLPLGPRLGPQTSVEVSVDTSQRGNYRLLLTQSDGVTHEIPMTVLPPNPKISNLPVRVNLDETHEAIHLEGSGMERVEGVFCDAGVVSGGPKTHGWSGQIALKPGLAQGQSFALLLKVKGLEDPLVLPDAVEVAGPRPKIRSVQKSIAGKLEIEIAPDELPAGRATGLVLMVDHLHDTTAGGPGGRPRLELGCPTGELRQTLSLSPGEPSGTANLTFAGPGALYLSVDPGLIGDAGCRLTATVTVDPEGRSDAFVLGRVIRLPRLDQFTLTSEKVGDSSYAGALEGHDLDVIEKAGWDAQHGVPVDSIPTPLPGDPSRQTLRVVMPWPAPAPHAPLYIWLRGEEQGRKTAVAY